MRVVSRTSLAALAAVSTGLLAAGCCPCRSGTTRPASAYDRYDTYPYVDGPAYAPPRRSMKQNDPEPRDPPPVSTDRGDRYGRGSDDGNRQRTRDD